MSQFSKYFSQYRIFRLAQLNKSWKHSRHFSFQGFKKMGDRECNSCSKRMIIVFIRQSKSFVLDNVITYSYFLVGSWNYKNLKYVVHGHVFNNVIKKHWFYCSKFNERSETLLKPNDVVESDIMIYKHESSKQDIRS